MQFAILVGAVSALMSGIFYVIGSLHLLPLTASLFWPQLWVVLSVLLFLAGGALWLQLTFFLSMWVYGRLLMLFRLEKDVARWCPPSQCFSFGAWVSHGWSGVCRSRTGEQTKHVGYRWLGFEVALEGTLSP